MGALPERDSMAARKTKADKAADARINAAYREVGNGIQIDIFDITKVFKVGAAAIAAGADDDTLKATLAGYLETIRKN